MSGTANWVNLIVAFTALVTALGIIWKAAKPLFRYLMKLHEVVGMVPFLRMLKKASENLFTNEEKKP